MSIYLRYYLRQIGVSRPLIVRRTPQGLIVRDRKLVKLLNGQGHVVLADTQESIDWLVRNTDRSVVVTQQGV